MSHRVLVISFSTLRDAIRTNRSTKSIGDNMINVGDVVSVEIKTISFPFQDTKQITGKVVSMSEDEKYGFIIDVSGEYHWARLN